MMETLPLIRRHDIACIGDIQHPAYPGIGRRKIVGCTDPMNRQAQTGKIFQHRMIHQPRILRTPDGARRLHPAQRSCPLSEHQDPFSWVNKYILVSKKLHSKWSFF